MIALEDVEELIKSMGTVADFEAIEEEEDLAAQAAADKAPPQATAHLLREVPNRPLPKAPPAPSRKLVRDTKRKLLGGVCASIISFQR